MKTFRPVLLGLVIIGAVAYALWAKHERDHPGAIILSGTIEADDIAVGTKIGGRVVEVLADEGDSVEAGQVLVRLDRDVLDADLARLRASLSEARAQLLQLENGARVEDIAEAEAMMAQRQATLNRLLTGSRQEDIDRARAEWRARDADAQMAAITLRRLQSMATEGVVSAQELDTAQAAADAAAAQADAARRFFEQIETGPRTEDIDEARAALAAARAMRDRVVAGPRSEEIQAARARVLQMEAQIERLQVDVAETEISAPVAAVVEVLDLEPGDLVAPNQPVATLLLPDALWVRVYIPEDRLGWASVGQQVDVRVDSWPGQVFQGTVEQVNRRAEFTPRNVQTVDERVRQVFGIRVRLDNAGDRLRAGMAADVTIPPPRGRSE